MNDLDQRERAQLGLQYIEDAVVNLLVQHPKGLRAGQIAKLLELSEAAIGPGVLDELVKSSRILWDGATGIYLDNPQRY
jgi:hypothetical protein